MKHSWIDSAASETISICSWCGRPVVHYEGAEDEWLAVGSLFRPTACRRSPAEKHVAV